MPAPSSNLVSDCPIGCNKIVDRLHQASNTSVAAVVLESAQTITPNTTTTDEGVTKNDDEETNNSNASTSPTADSPNSFIIDTNGDVDRTQFKKYWESARKEFGPTVVGMLLKPSVEDAFECQDKYEILDWITPSAQQTSPPIHTLVELGAGIGRMTPLLMSLCTKLIAVDFIEEYLDKNRKTNASDSRPLDEYVCGDATQLRYADESIDFLFWNWLLMYLSEDETRSFLCRAASWVRIGGLVFCRESCGEPSTKSIDRPWAEEGNPTIYRQAEVYTKLLSSYIEEKTGVIFEPIFIERPVSVYQKEIGTQGQQAWLLRRIK